MELQDRKCVMILNEELPAGVLANTAGILGITLGKKVPENIGPDIYDKDGREHLGIVALPVPVLNADKEKLKDYIAKAAGAGEEELTYLGVGICGSKKLVNRLSGSLPLLR